MNLLRLATCLSLLTAWPLFSHAAPLLKSGDRIVLLGGTLIEREQVEGYWETPVILSASFPVTWNNLGWSGDTVWSDSRGMFDPPAKGYERMLEQIGQINPTVIIIGYGNSEAFNGPGSLDAFKKQYAKLLQDLKGENRRFVLLTPTPMEASEIPGQSPEQQIARASHYNASASQYADAIAALAAETGATLVDLSPAFSPASGDLPMTDNGITLNAFGYWKTGQLLSTALTGSTPDARVLPAPTMTSVSPRIISEDASPTERLRAVIRDKNELLFHRWRPQNFTYLFGFRKHEQGNNAVEIPQFDPLVQELEARIQSLKPAP